MKICGISDIHGNLIDNIPQCNVLCICGDVIKLNCQRSMEASGSWWATKFVKWANKIDCDKIIVVPGNHDFYIEMLYKSNKFDSFKNMMRDFTDNKVEFLIDESLDHEGILFYGTPWIKPVDFQEDRWAFSSQDHFNNIIYCDVLLTHDSPLGNEVLDYYSFGKSKYHLYGHWHDGANDVNYGRYNCSRLDDCYNFKTNYEFIVLDIMTEKEKKQVEQEFLNKVIELAKGITFSAGENCVSDWLIANFKEPELQQDIEDTVEWDTSHDIFESAVISDMED